MKSCNKLYYSVYYTYKIKFLGVHMIKKFLPHCIEKILFFIGFFLFTSEILKQLLLTFIVNDGHYNLWYFPFQLCSLPMYLLVLYPFFRTESTRNTVLGFLATYNLLGGIAVFFDTSGMHYPLLILTVHSYLWHILLIVTGILSGILLIQKLSSESCISDKKHNKRQPTRASSRHLLPSFAHITLLYILFVLIAEYLNHVLDSFGEINLFYINPDYRMEQVFFIKIGELCGNNTAILVYILATIFGAGILYEVWNFTIHFYSSH